MQKIIFVFDEIEKLSDRNPKYSYNSYNSYKITKNKWYESPPKQMSEKEIIGCIRKIIGKKLPYGCAVYFVYKLGKNIKIL